jgi:hypothetical protein
MSDLPFSQKSRLMPADSSCPKLAASQKPNIFRYQGTSWLDDKCGKNTESASFLFKMAKKGKLFFLVLNP